MYIHRETLTLTQILIHSPCLTVSIIIILIAIIIIISLTVHLSANQHSHQKFGLV